MQRAFRKNRERAVLFGVCAGLGDYFNWDALWIRLVFVTLALLGFGLPILIYLAIALLAD